MQNFLSTQTELKTCSVFPTLSQSQATSVPLAFTWDGRPCLLMQWLHGVKPSPCAEIFFQIGQQLGILHSTCPPPNIRSLLPNYFSFSYSLLLTILSDIDVNSNHNEFCTWLKNSIVPFQVLFEDVGILHENNSSSWVLCHGDVFLDNIIADSTSKILVGIIDFEDICIGHPLLDLGVALVGLGKTTDHDINLEAIVHVCIGYKSRSHCSIDKEILYKILLYVCCGLAEWRFSQYNLRFSSMATKNWWKDFQPLCLRYIGP